MSTLWTVLFVLSCMILIVQVENTLHSSTTRSYTFLSELQKTADANQQLQAAEQAAESQHLSNFQTATRETEVWGASCATTVAHMNKAVSENDQTQHLTSKTLNDVTVLLDTAQNQITQSVADTSGLITQEVIFDALYACFCAFKIVAITQTKPYLGEYTCVRHSRSRGSRWKHENRCGS